MRKHYYRWIVNNWVHDVGTGLWFAALLVIWRLDMLSAGVPAEAAAALAPVSREMFRLMIASLVVIGVTGGIRLRYWRNENTADELPYKRRSLLVKHGVYLAIYLPGTVWAYLLQR